jgi:hypothetical protein
MIAKNAKRMVIVRATLVVQGSSGTDADHIGLVSEFERGIDTTDVLRRVGSATIQHNAELVEVRCDVEYGPIRANEADMRRHLERQARALASSLGGRESAVFNVVPVELTSREQLDEIIGSLTARSNDIAVPLALRTQLATVVTRLRRGADAGRVPRQPASGTPEILVSV